jgi:hypothetical protein
MVVDQRGFDAGGTELNAERCPSLDNRLFYLFVHKISFIGKRGRPTPTSGRGNSSKSLF